MQTALFESSLVIVDLETTGGNFERDRITEIGIIRVEQGAVVDRWSTLVNPQIPIPARITQYTGISDEMVASAPCFSDLATEVWQRLTDAIFIAHNVRFDYGFLFAAYASLGLMLDLSVLCTVKYSRALYPQFTRHGLDAIIARHGYQIAARHRALDDAQIVWQFLQDCRLNFTEAELSLAQKRAGSKQKKKRKPQLGEMPSSAQVSSF